MKKKREVMDDEKEKTRENRTILEIDITDWVAEHDHLEEDLSTLQAAIEVQMRERLGPTQMGRLLLVDRLKGLNQEEILSKSEKLLLGFGAAVEYSGKVAAQRRKVQLKNGREFQIRAYMGRVKRDEAGFDEDELETGLNGAGEDDGGLIASVGPKAARRASAYLERVAPGHIQSRLAIMAASGDEAGLKRAADLLKAQIDRMVEEMSGGVEE